MARKEQILGNGALTIENTGKGVGQYNKALRWIERYQADGQHPQHGDEYECPEVGNVDGRFFYPPPQRIKTHAPDHGEYSP